MKSTNPLRGVITDDVVNAMRERIEARRQEAIAQMDCKYLLHPFNQVAAHSHDAHRAQSLTGMRLQVCPHCFIIHQHSPV